ncbi:MULTISPECIES: hypothetical protein [Ralstonia]|jgi:hypothetical protein|uniref:Transmembrane protein n=1 Tax=Ralstonia flaminis TaxID=3058597 RepID=A0ABM9K515_9RALS|nr:MULTISPECIES: hypothetical protein [unclassified Ralstonia]CAJ0815132.1 hypothetical protein LMG18101_02485 [Ralstonia sp. LMG 18101]
MLAIGAGIAWFFFILGPLRQAQAAATTVRYSLRVMVLLAGCLVFGLGLLIGSDKLAWHDAQRASASPRSAGRSSAGFYWWFKQQFSALGYDT